MAFAFVDVETTGLNPENSQLLEVAILVANKEFEIIDEINVSIKHERVELDLWILDNLEEVVRTSLLGDKDSLTLPMAENVLRNFMFRHFMGDKPPMCGNSLTLDRNFLAKYMPNLYSMFHYRSIDVSSFMVARDILGMETCAFGEPTHRAIEDCRRSLKQLKWYTQRMHNGDDE